MQEIPLSEQVIKKLLKVVADLCFKVEYIESTTMNSLLPALLANFWLFFACWTQCQPFFPLKHPWARLASLDLFTKTLICFSTLSCWRHSDGGNTGVIASTPVRRTLQELSRSQTACSMGREETRGALSNGWKRKQQKGILTDSLQIK